jgi:Pyruvate/2-oxoacid:ferredoxin oxidoreductase gamma subunit
VKSRGKDPYITFKDITGVLYSITPRIHVIDCTALAKEAGNALATNTVLLGALARIEGFPLTIDQLNRAMLQVVPSNAMEANSRALSLGFNAVALVT